MPRDGSNIYHKPFPDVAPNTTVASAVYNGFVADVEQDLNLPRPIVAGGTGSSSAAGSLANLGGETASQVVTNYDSQLWMPGSFYSAAGATNAPVAGHAFVGTVTSSDVPAYPPTNQNVVVRAYDQNDTVVPGLQYTREKKAGVWGAWTAMVVGIGATINTGSGSTLNITYAIAGAGSGGSAIISKYKAAEAGRIDFNLANGTLGAEVAQLDFYTTNAGVSTKRMTLGPTGNLGVVGGVISTGPTAILKTSGQDDPAYTAALYATGGSTHLWDSAGGDFLTGSSGSVSIPQNLSVGKTIGANVLNISGAANAINQFDRNGNGSSTGYFRNAGTTYFFDSNYGYFLTAAGPTVGVPGNLTVGSAPNNWAGAVVHSQTSGAWALSGWALAPGGGVLLARIESTNSFYAYFQYQSLLTGYIQTDGATTLYATSSDARKKTDPKPFDGMAIVLDLKPYDFQWKETGARAHGVYAQEAALVYPEACSHVVNEKDDVDVWGVDYSKFAPVLIRALQQAEARIARLEALVAGKPIP